MINRIFTRALCILFMSYVMPGMGWAQETSRRAVIQVSMDYAEAMYTADTEIMESCLHDNFIKYGYYWKGSTETFSDMTRITRDQMVQIANDWNKDKWVPADAPKDVALLDMQEKIAVVKLTAYWGIEYLQIAEVGSAWKIVQVLSQNWSKKLSQEEEDR